MKVLSAAEMSACDRVTVERFGVPSIELMRAAAGAVAGLARELYPKAQRVTVLCGRGNNGGDGMMAARLLAAAGCEVTTLLLGAPEGFGGDAATAWGELLASAAPGTVRVVETAEDLASHADALDADLIVDAIVGTGFKAPLKGLALAALEWVKGHRGASSSQLSAISFPMSQKRDPSTSSWQAMGYAAFLAVDLPSGWEADSTAAAATGPVFPADAVITFTSPKTAHVFGQLTRKWDQPVVVAAIGSPAEAMKSKLNVHWAGAAMEMVQQPRAADSNKGKFGHVLVVGGSVGRSGAPSMTSLATLRAGAGLVTAAVPEPILPLVAAIAPELMTFPLKANTAGQIAASLTPEDLEQMVAGKTVLAIGPGLGQGRETIKFTTDLLWETKMPAVIDADALNILAGKPTLLVKLAKGRTVVLTPHPGEMARLAGISVAEVQADRLGVARDFVKRTGVTLVLKGARTLIAHPGGRVAVNTTGNPGMAKGGSGDLLTGLVAGMLAQYPKDAGLAVEAAVYLHGLAADMAVNVADEHTLLATDSLQQLSRAFRFYSRGENGYVWLQGALHKETPSEVRE
jgi:ADP-dependent NAD(P)H-hydrate dehydratase / NAD(P)H-hydrate epimerase